MRINQNIKDFFSTTSFARKIKKDPTVYSNTVYLEYKFPDMEDLESKNLIHNLNEIEKYITNVIIKPKQIFSFWKIIGNPTKLEIVNPELGFSITSSLLYHLSLISGLSVLERHHSIFDYFHDDSRYFPLGTDAEILYESKDLRIKNILPFSIKLKFEISQKSIKGCLITPKKIVPNKISFQETHYKNYKEVFTRINRRTIAVSIYKNP